MCRRSASSPTRARSARPMHRYLLVGRAGITSDGPVHWQPGTCRRSATAETRSTCGRCWPVRAELLPWLLQWYDEADADPSLDRPGSQIAALVDAELRSLHLVPDDLTGWRPAPAASRKVPPMTLLRELIDIPEQVYKSDFVISLKTAIEEPDKTLAEYVVTDQLAACFRHALGLITSAAAEGRSKAAYLHASFGAGKSAFMAVSDLLLAGVPAARANAKLAPIVAEFAGALDGRRFLLVPYQAVGAISLEQVVLGGYVEHVRALHPDKALPAVYVADGILADARIKRIELGDETFLRLLSEGDAADEWGTYGAGWGAERFDAALAAGRASSGHDQLVSALLRTHYRAVPGQAQATSEGFVPIDDGLEAISRHAKSLGYDAVVLFLDERAVVGGAHERRGVREQGRRQGRQARRGRRGAAAGADRELDRPPARLARAGRRPRTGRPVAQRARHPAPL